MGLKEELELEFEEAIEQINRANLVGKWLFCEMQKPELDSDRWMAVRLVNRRFGEIHADRVKRAEEVLARLVDAYR